jgi:hypothetical protein
MDAHFFNAWDQKGLNRLVVNCINRVPPSKPRPTEMVCFLMEHSRD